VYSEITFSLGTRTGRVLTVPFEKILNSYTGVEGKLFAGMTESNPA